ncbi:MAG: pyridoxamine 5'-phosphate oxidase family protein [Thermoplasmata archaeon]
MRITRDERAQFDLDEFLSRPLLAHLATGSEDGARESPLWYLWEDGAFWFVVEQGYNTYHERASRQPNVAIGLVDFDPRSGRLQHVGVRGRASIAPWDDDRASGLLRRYYRHLDGYEEPPEFRGRKPVAGAPWSSSESTRTPSCCGSSRIATRCSRRARIGPVADRRSVPGRRLEISRAVVDPERDRGGSRVNAYVGRNADAKD